MNTIKLVYLAGTILLSSTCLANNKVGTEIETCQSLSPGDGILYKKYLNTTVSHNPVFVKQLYTLLRACSLAVPELNEFATYCGLPEIPIVVTKVPAKQQVLYSACRLRRLQMLHNNDDTLVTIHYVSGSADLTNVYGSGTVSTSTMKALLRVHDVNRADFQNEIRNLE